MLKHQNSIIPKYQIRKIAKYQESNLFMKKLILKNPSLGLMANNMGDNSSDDIANIDVPTTHGNHINLHTIRLGSAEQSIQIELHTRPAFGLVLGRNMPGSKKTATKGILQSANLNQNLNSSLNLSSNQDVNLASPVASFATNKSDKPQIIGLFKFAAATRNLIQASFKDDPYADLVLLHLEELLDELDAEINTSIATITHLTKNLIDDGITVRRMKSRVPVKIELTFNSQYAMRLAMIIIKYDKLVRMCMPLRQLQIIDYDHWVNAFTDARSKYRQLVTAAIHYRPIGGKIMRTTYDPSVSHKVTKSFGEMPQDILEKIRRPKMIYPSLVKPTHNAEPSVSLASLVRKLKE